jgi:hypothetical protein
VKIRSLILIGVLAFLWTALLHAPAASLYAWFGPKAAQVQLFGLEGSLDEGKVQTLGVNGRPLLQNLRWSFQPWWLPLLRASFHLESAGSDLRLNGRAALVPGGINVAAAEASGNLKPLLGLAGFPFLPVDGRVHLQLDSLKLRHGFPAAVEGNAELHGLSFALGPNPVPLGDFKAVLGTQAPATGTSTPAGIRIVVSTLGGPLDLSGEVHVQADRNYDYDLQLKAKPGADPGLANLLQGGSLGAPDPNGYYHLRNRGQLPG